jgi:lipid-binding SYLF domain-containing protein
MKKLLLAACLTLASPAAALAETSQHLVDSATLALEDMAGDNNSGQQVRYFLRHARAVVLCPDIFRGAFIFGGEGGGCVMVGRNPNGGWSYPAFYTLASGSWGLQIGVQDAEVMMLIMTQGGLNALLSSQFKFGADAGLTVATIGAGVNGSMSTAINADILSLSQTEGLYGGLSLSGSIFDANDSRDSEYYGSDLEARQIVIDQQGQNPGANPLRTLLSRYGD